LASSSVRLVAACCCTAGSRHCSLEALAHAAQQVEQFAADHFFGRPEDRLDVLDPIDLGPAVEGHEGLDDERRVERITGNFAQPGEQLA
jgi:hypothetical protein